MDKEEIYLNFGTLLSSGIAVRALALNLFSRKYNELMQQKKKMSAFPLVFYPPTPPLIPPPTLLPFLVTQLTSWSWSLELSSPGARDVEPALSSLRLSHYRMWYTHFTRLPTVNRVTYTFMLRYFGYCVLPPPNSDLRRYNCSVRSYSQIINNTVVTFQMSQYVIWIGWQQD